MTASTRTRCGDRASRGAESPLAQSRGDPLAFADFYDALSGRVLDFFTRRTWDRQVSLDLTAETFAKAFEKRLDFRGDTEEQAAGWLWAIARNELGAYWRERALCLAALQRLSRHEATADFGDEIARIEELAAIESARDQLRAALMALSADQREAIGLRLLQELDYEEIALRLGVSAQLVRAWVSRGLRSLRRSPGLRASIE